MYHDCQLFQWTTPEPVGFHWVGGCYNSSLFDREELRCSSGLYLFQIELDKRNPRYRRHTSLWIKYV